MSLICPSRVPYHDLYIYYLEGRLTPDFQINADGFIGNWEEDGFSFLFFQKPSDEEVEKMIRLQPQVKVIDRYVMTYDQWHGDKISSFQAGCFTILPPWEDLCGKEGLKNPAYRMVLDPGVVFGTGLHPTTSDCLCALETAFDEKPSEFVMDIGTGTGILALAAAKLGAARTLAVDLNLLSVKTANNNIRLNRLENKILAVQGAADNFMDYPVDFMIANIHYDVMQKIINTKGFYRKKRFLLSGLLKSQAKSVRDRLAQMNVEILRTWDQNGIWFTFLGKTH
jgi:ribosomal protein L11 methyltransferase